MGRTTLSQLPEGFLWGAATAGHQTEGNNTSSDFWAKEGIVPGRGTEYSGDACDSYHRFAEDIALLAGAGLTCYRFSLEWSRIEPREGHFSRAELLHYREVIDTCLERGVTPIVTLNHFTVPAWFASSGGWRRPDAADRFERYVEYCCAILVDVEWVVTLNEPNMMGLFELMEDRSTGASDGDSARSADSARIATVGMSGLGVPGEDFARRIGAVHRAAVAVLRERTNAKVGWGIAVQSFTPADESTPTSGWVSALQHHWENLYFEAASGDDFIGVQSYGVKMVGPSGPLPAPDHPDNTQTGMAFRPDAVGVALRRAWSRTGLPLFVTENGIATARDEQRIAYIDGAVEAVTKVAAEGATVVGYCYWSLLDNYEWGSWEPTFGLIAVDRERDFARRPKPSLAHLGAMAQQQRRG